MKSTQANPDPDVRRRGNTAVAVSRKSMPKQFVPLIGPTSTFQPTLQRVAHPLFARPIVITNVDFRFIVAEQLRELGIAASIVLEPARRDSGPAVAVALAAQRDPTQPLIFEGRSPACSPMKVLLRVKGDLATAARICGDIPCGARDVRRRARWLKNCWSATRAVQNHRRNLKE